MTKTFDCVAMKNRIQAEIMAAYEARQHEFASFAEFVKAAAAEAEFVQEMRKKFGRPGKL